jgi:hypothetical protein
MTDTTSRVVRVKHRGKETAETLLEADNTSIRLDAEGCLIVQLFRYGADERALESYQFHFSADDRRRIREIA